MVSRRFTPLRILREWRRYSRIIHEAIKETVPEAEAYLAGGAAENRLTIHSDIDVLVVLPRTPTFQEAVELRARILERAEELGLPPYAPVELHIIGKEDLKRYTSKGRVIPIKDVYASGRKESAD